VPTVGEFCNRRVVIADKAESLHDAASRMRSEHVGSLVVVEGGPRGQRMPIGVLTDRDIVVAVLARSDRHLSSITVEDAMTPNPATTAREGEDLALTMKKMRDQGVRRIPVVNAAGELAGITCFDDVLEYLAGELDGLARVLPRQREREIARRS
jgi:CBS domain-containing protein